MSWQSSRRKSLAYCLYVALPLFTAPSSAAVTCHRRSCKLKAVTHNTSIHMRNFQQTRRHPTARESCAHCSLSSSRSSCVNIDSAAFFTHRSRASFSSLGSFALASLGNAGGPGGLEGAYSGIITLKPVFLGRPYTCVHMLFEQEHCKARPLVSGNESSFERLPG